MFMRLRRNRMYFIFWRTRPPDMQISSQRTATTFCPLRSSLATIDASRPSMWWRASTTTRFAQIPDPDTIIRVPLSLFCWLFLSLFCSLSLSRTGGFRVLSNIYVRPNVELGFLGLHERSLSLSLSFSRN